MIVWYPYSNTIMEWRLRRVVPAAAVTTHAKPHAQQQLARDLEVERAAMGLLCAAARFGSAMYATTAVWVLSDLPSARGSEPIPRDDFVRH